MTIPAPLFILLAMLAVVGLIALGALVKALIDWNKEGM